MYFKKDFAEFTKKDLRDYSEFKEIVSAFQEHYGLKDYDYKKLDKYLWQLGREHFSKENKKK